jgi:hypothetical protein
VYANSVTVVHLGRNINVKPFFANSVDQFSSAKVVKMYYENVGTIRGNYFTISASGFVAYLTV